MDEVAIKTSSMLFIKHAGRLVVRVLTEAEISIVDANPGLMRSPGDLLCALDGRPAIPPEVTENSSSI